MESMTTLCGGKWKLTLSNNFLALFFGCHVQENGVFFFVIIFYPYHLINYNLHQKTFNPLSFCCNKSFSKKYIQKPVHILIISRYFAQNFDSKTKFLSCAVTFGFESYMLICCGLVFVLQRCDPYVCDIILGNSVLARYRPSFLMRTQRSRIQKLGLF